MPSMMLFGASEQELKLAAECGLVRENGMFGAYDVVYGTEEQLTLYAEERTLLRPEWMGRHPWSRLGKGKG